MKKNQFVTKLRMKIFTAFVLASILIITNVSSAYAYFANHVISGAVGMGAPLEGDDTVTPATEGYAYTGNGSYTNPYKIAISGNMAGATPNTRPSAFWGTWAGGTGASTPISHFKVVFENRGSTLDGKLMSSMTYDLIDHDSVGDGMSTEYVKDPTNIWDGSWTYAFRLAPWTEFDTSTGALRLAFAWKGQFSFYWKNWEFKFNAVDKTAGLSEDKQLHPGDRVALTYYGGYLTTQTSRGTNYTVDFSTTDLNAASKVEAVVDNDGYATFSGQDMIAYGGNYSVSKVVIPVDSINIMAENSLSVISQKNGSLQLGAALTPSNTTQKDYNWSIVSGGTLATIDQSGCLKANGTGNGSVVVRATSTNNSQIYGEYKVEISNNLTVITNTPSPTAIPTPIPATPSPTSIPSPTPIVTNTNASSNLSYKIVFKANGGSNLSKSSISAVYGSAYGTLPTCNRTNYVFNGWYTASKGGSKISSDTVCTKGTTYYAHWTKVSVSANSIKSLKTGSKKITVKYKAISKAMGYQIRYSLKSNMTSAKIVATKSTGKTITKLKSKKKYYVQVRAYKLDSKGKKVYGRWSSMNAIKVK